jgi:hypothetical protein
MIKQIKRKKEEKGKVKTKNIILKESQFKRLIEDHMNEVSAIDIADTLKNIPCTGEGIKSIMNKKIMNHGFEDVNIKFLGYGKDNKKVLRYIVHTEGPIFIIDTMSNSETQPPCMEVMDVIAYTKA